jgi:hypothetical protein
MTRSFRVDRALYDDVCRQRDEAVQDRRAADARYEALVTEMTALKRHDIAAGPNATDLNAWDPTNGLGGRTLMAVEEFAAGDPELRRKLIATAHTLTAAERLQTSDPDQVDEIVAEKIIQGDQ